MIDSMLLLECRSIPAYSLISGSSLEVTCHDLTIHDNILRLRSRLEDYQALPFASVADKAATIAKIGLYRAHTQSAPSMSALKREFRLSVSRVTASRTAGKRRMVTRKPSELTLSASVLRHNGRIN